MMNNPLTNFVDDIADCFVSTLCRYNVANFYDLSYVAAQKFEREFHDIVDERYNVITTEKFEAIKAEYPISPMLKILERYGLTKPDHSLIPMLNVLKNRRVVLYSIDDLGIPVTYHTTVNYACIKDYAQHKEALFLVHTPKGKRKQRIHLTLPHNDLVIYDGWVNLDIERKTMNIEDKGNVIVKQGKYLSFDKRYISDVIEQTPIQPLLVKHGSYR